MSLKKVKRTFHLFLLSLFILPLNVLAYSDYLIPGGENIGIQIQSKGIIVVGTYKIKEEDIASNAGIQKGDQITAINGKNISSIDEMVKTINASKDLKLSVSYKRDNEEHETTLKVVKDDENIYKTGLYVKDSVTGIGTLTFIDPNTKIFGALGHEVVESNTGIRLEVKNGKIFKASVTDIDRSENGKPGSKNADLDVESKTGTIVENTDSGIFGEYLDQLPNKQKYKVASLSDIKKEEATILTVLNGNEIKEYRINILKVKGDSNSTKNILFEVTDPELLKQTGGVVQGMSGSPIIQGDFIIGAVTHVVVDNPTRGYGILITNMLEEAEN